VPGRKRERERERERERGIPALGLVNGKMETLVKSGKAPPRHVRLVLSSVAVLFDRHRRNASAYKYTRDF
jgi:hypothetical protein